MADKTKRTRREYKGLVVSDDQPVTRYTDVAEYCVQTNASVKRAAEHFDVPEHHIRAALAAKGLAKQVVTQWSAPDTGEVAAAE